MLQLLSDTLLFVKIYLKFFFRKTKLIGTPLITLWFNVGNRSYFQTRINFALVINTTMAAV